MRATLSVVVGLFVAVSGCSSSKSAEKSDTAATPAAAGENDLKNKMGNCPSAVAGSTTTIEDMADGIAVIIKGADEAGTTEIRARSARLAQSAAAAVTGEHNRGGGSGGGAGHCPVILKDTTITAEDVEGGSKITVKPAAPEGLEALKTESRAKVTALPEIMKKIGG